MKKKGFTLIEILAVVTIMGLIFLLVIPKISNSLKSKKTDIDKTTKSMIVSAAKLYVNDNKDSFYKDNENIYCLPISQLVKKQYLDTKVKNVTDDIDITNSMSVKITYENKFKYELVDKKDCQVVKQENKNIEYLVNKANPVTVANYTDGNTNEMYTFSHSTTTQTEALTDYRYIGVSPKNYVEFNNELWRIIGIFTVEDENGNKVQRIKIVRNSKLNSDYYWDANWSNEWPTSSLKNYLNGEYYNSLTDTAKSMIGNTKYYLGGGRNNGSSHYGTADEMYAWERGTTVYPGRSFSWVGQIGLMYPSDYAYTYALGVDNTCYNDSNQCNTGIPNYSWIYKSNGNSYQWLLSHDSNNEEMVFGISAEGEIVHDYVDGLYYARPTLYLVSNIQIDSGDGSEQNPYKLKI